MKLKNVTKHTRAPRGNYGTKGIICPSCNAMTHVSHFAWQAMECKHCHKTIDKYSWLIKPKPQSKPAPCALCGRATIYESQLDHPYHWENIDRCYECGFQQADAEVLKIAYPIELRCPWIILSTGLRCEETRIVTPEEIEKNLSFRCPRCRTFTGAKGLILNNLPILRERLKDMKTKHHARGLENGAGRGGNVAWIGGDIK